MDNLSEDEKLKIQTNKMFNSTEGVIKQWISKFTKTPVVELFDVVPETEPIIFMRNGDPDGKYVALTLEIVDHKYSADIPIEF